MFLFFSESSELVWQAEASADPSVVVDNPIPVVLLVLDEFPLSSIVTPQGEINVALFPNFARLAESSHWFQNAQSNSIATTDSVPIILSSEIREGASPTSRDHPRTLFTMLGESYAMDVNETITRSARPTCATTTDRPTRSAAPSPKGCGRCCSTPRSCGAIAPSRRRYGTGCPPSTRSGAGS